MKKPFLFLIIIIAASLSCKGQPRSDYIIEWNGSTDSSSIFVWEGSDTTQCPFVEDQDYLNPNVSSYFITNAIGTSKTIQLNNDGNYVIVAMISKGDKVYSGLAKSAAYRKPTIPTKPAMIRIYLQ